MDQHGEKEADNKSQDSADEQHRKDDDEAAAEEKPDTSAEESMGERAGYKAEESEVVVAGFVESSSPAAALFAHPCSLLQLLLRACAGCLGFHGDDDDPKPAAVAAAPEDDDDADPSQEGDGGDNDKAANYLYVQEEVLTRVFAVRRPTPPGDRPREGSGGNGGVHH